MKRTIIAALALIFLVGLQPQAARAQNNTNWNSWNSFWYWWGHGQDPRLTAAGVGLGIAAGVTGWALTHKHGNPGHRTMSTGAAYGVTTVGCIVVYPMVGTIVLNRPLTPREAYTGMADCVVPFIGGWLVDAILPHDAWTDGKPPKVARRHG